MYKNIEILDKKEHKLLKFADLKAQDVAKNIALIPLGANEVLDMSCEAPVLITAGDSAEFVVFSGVSKEISIFNNENTYVPKFIQGYPFLSVFAKAEDDTLNSVIGLDNSQHVGKKQKISIFSKGGELEALAEEKIQKVRALSTQRDISKKIIAALKEKGLLLKRDFRVKTEDKEQVILPEFYIVDRMALAKLDDATLASWARKGWMSVIDASVKSLSGFEKVLQSKI